MKSLNNQRLRLVLLGLLCFAGVTLLAITLFADAVLGKKSHELVDLKLQSKVVDAQLLGLAQSKKEVAQYLYFNDIAKTVLPSDKDQAQAVLDINQFAIDSGISIASISFPASTLGSSGASATTNNSASTAPTQSVVSQAKPVDGIPGLYGLDLTISSESSSSVPDAKKATYPKLLDFLGRIERNRRTAQITQVNIQPVITELGPSPFINFTLTTKIFIKP